MTATHRLSGAAPAAVPAGTALEHSLAELESADEVLLTPSGTAAAICVLTALTNPGGHLVVSEDLYGPLREWLEAELPLSGRTVSLVDCTDPDQVAAALRPQTQLVYAQALADPLMRPCPVNDLSALAHMEDLLLVVDNTGLSPAAHRPLDAGAAVVVEDCGPCLDGHGGDPAGLVAGPHRLLARVRAHARTTGAVTDPAGHRWLGQALRTLPLRVRQQQESAGRVAAALAGHRAVSAVHRPTFDSHPWARETHDGFGGLLSFETAPDAPDGAAVVAALRAAGVVGDGSRGTESAASVPASSSHSGWSGRDRARAGVHPRLVRLSVGIEDPGPLIDALTRALQEAGPC